MENVALHESVSFGTIIAKISFKAPEFSNF
jgi:hypothetical protein